MKRSSLRASAVCALLTALSVGGGRSAWAVEPPSGEESEASPLENARERARSRFEQGTIHYSLGEYEQAIALFREAYELSAAPDLLFDIAQALRLKGDCRQSLEVYRHFVRLAPDSPRAGDAQVQIEALPSRCPAEGSQATPPANAAPKPKDPSLVQTATAPQTTQAPAKDANSGSTRRQKMAKSLFVGGLVLAAGTGAIYLWNDSRYDHWNAEDAQLKAGPRSGADPDSWLRRQDQNDALWRSVRRVDTALGVMAGVSAAAVLGSTVLGLLPERDVQVSMGPGAAQVTWTVTWL